MAEKVSAFVHIEIVHDDPAAAASFMAKTLGAVQVEKRLSTYFETLAPDMRVIHMRAGNVVFQFVKPVAGLESWHSQFKASGPGVHNVTIQVNNLEQVRQELLDEGCKQIAEFHPALRDGGLDVDGPITCYVIDATAQAGLKFEMIETLPAWVSGEAA
jgi:4-hydroxyphenylpyruvate dioxygenase-like putative hemolysin